jgi:Raf kinase inhibitor-like YbhB/YbcL family protein
MQAAACGDAGTTDEIRRGSVLRGGGSRRDQRETAAAWLAGLVAGSLLLGGCGLLGKPRSLVANAPATMSINSPVFTENVMPARFTCYGARVSPPIFWSAPPPGTKSLALVLDDAATPVSPRVYWFVFDISPNAADLQVGSLPPHARVAENSSGKANYDAPCPRGGPHNYRFTVYALNTFFGNSLPANARLLQALTTIAPHVTARGTMTVKVFPGGVSG